MSLALFVCITTTGSGHGEIHCKDRHRRLTGLRGRGTLGLIRTHMQTTLGAQNLRMNNKKNKRRLVVWFVFVYFIH